jgi:hypothetical protein
MGNGLFACGTAIIKNPFGGNCGDLYGWNSGILEMENLT